MKGQHAGEARGRAAAQFYTLGAIKLVVRLLVVEYKVAPPLYSYDTSARTIEQSVGRRSIKHFWEGSKSAMDEDTQILPAQACD